jgi:hypothetical protein
MPGFISKPHGEDLDFELFSNIVLKFTAILMVVLVLLAINVGQKLDQIISPYRFSGGLARPQLYLGAYALENWINVEQTMAVTLYSASFFEASTVVNRTTGEVGSKVETETFSGMYGSQPYTALALLAGISPGSIPIDGKQTPFVVPHFTTKTTFYHDKGNNSRYGPPSQQLAHNFLKIWSNSYANPVYPTRAFSEYRDVRTRIYVETLRTAAGEHFFVVGHERISAAQIKAGRLDFLTSLSSTNTEVVYLGIYHHHPAQGAESRLDFYEENGFVDAAKHLRSRLFPGAAERSIAKDFYNRLPGWDQLSSDQKSVWLNDAKGDAQLAREQYEASITRRADSDYRNSLVEDALKKDAGPDVYGLPNILAYPDAWQAYVDYRMKANPTPPEWFVTEFLQPLGFDKRVVVIEQ